MERYICIHGHFYQPPRENPWLEAVETQDSAHPYHDWNERVTSECYGPNAAARILNGKGRVALVVNNYSKISFNFGPTLLAWLESNAPDVYQAILDADRESQKNFSGHGSALAQAYNHMILPLANARDKYTQVLWGIRDFEHRFGRRPEGMWLPETAVDLETLEILARLGIRFTVLAPHQAKRVRRIGEREWHDVSTGTIDPAMPYLCLLPSGARLELFFYDGAISSAVAFERLLDRGEDFAHRLVSAFSPARTGPRLVHIATDGESYGHHHRFGEMALAYALQYIEANGMARLTNYGEYLERHQPTHEVEVLANTSWSCSHGVERWRSDCGCGKGDRTGWSQGWRAPLRQAMDWLRNTLASQYEEKARAFFKDPWAARDAYIEVVLDRSLHNVEHFLHRYGANSIDAQERVTALKLLELQRHTMLMYTSCGWFFEEPSRIETVQVLQYAARAVQLGQELFGVDLEEEFLALLGRAESNVPAYGDCRRIYQELVTSTVADMQDAVAHCAVGSLFETYPKQAKVYCYTLDLEERREFRSERAFLAVGQVLAHNTVTTEAAAWLFAVLRVGDYDVMGRARRLQAQDSYDSMVYAMAEAFQGQDLQQVVRLMDHHLGVSSFSLASLLRDEHRKILRQLQDSALTKAEAAHSLLLAQEARIVRSLSSMGMPLPRTLFLERSFFLNRTLRKALSSEGLEPGRISSLLEEARELGLEVDRSELIYLLEKRLEREMARLLASPGDLLILQAVAADVTAARAVPLPLDLGRTQGLYYRLLVTLYPSIQQRAREGDPESRRWLSLFESLGEKLSVALPGAS
ncbi:MAG: DUF3536 domain-containing protein [Chloroflexi bacterium]|nr:DUF3536 domain-containing protein [Chloroflexota bacterium]